MKAENQLLFEKNLKLLTVWLRQMLEKVDDETLWRSIEVTHNADGYPVCLYHRDGKRFHITSEQPMQESQRWYNAHKDVEGTGAIFLYGCGFGYPIMEIFAHKKSHTLVVVFEEDICLFKAMLYFFDFEPIVKTGKIAFLIGSSEDFAVAFEQLFFNVSFISCTYPDVVYTLPAQRNFKAQYIKIHREVFEKLSLLVLYLGNDHFDNLLGFVNMMANAKEIAENPHISCLKNQYKGFPAFVVSNGPSLDKNIEALKEVRGRGLIICVESAIVPLLKHHIAPDILAVIERIRASYELHFKDIAYPKGISLLSLAVADPRVFAAFPGERVPILRDKEIVNLWTSSYLGDGSVIDAGVNVSHLATEIAVYLGADPVIFVGQDFAYGEDDGTHSKDSIYAEEKGRQYDDRIKSRTTVYTEGNSAPRVRSNQMWMDFKQGLELKIAAHPGKTFINATQGGAKIIGMQCMRLFDAIQQYCKGPIPRRVDELIRENKEEISPEERERSVADYMSSIQKYIKLFREAAREGQQRALECKKMLCLSKKNQKGKYNALLEEAYQTNIKIFGRLIMNGMFRCFLQQVIFANYYLLNRLKAIDTEDKIREVFKTHFHFFSHIRVICQSVSIHFEDALITLKKQFPEIKDGDNNDR